MTTLMLFDTDPKKSIKNTRLSKAWHFCEAFLLQIKDLYLATISYTILCSIIAYSMQTACYVTAACVLCTESEFGWADPCF